MMNEKQIKFLIELREESKRLDEIFDRIEKRFKSLNKETKPEDISFKTDEEVYIPYNGSK